MADTEEQVEIDEGAAEASSVVEDAPGYDWGDLAEHDLVKRHAGDPAKIVQSFESLQKEFHARNQQPAEPEVEEEPWSPLQGAPAPANVDPEFYGRVEQNYRMDPVGTFRELVQGGPEYMAYTALVYEALEAQIGKFQTQQLYVSIQREIDSEAQQEAFDAKLQEAMGQLQPVSQHVQMQIADVAIAAARQEAPDFDDFMQRIVDAIAKNPAYVADVRGDSAATTERMLQMRDMFWAADQRKALTESTAEPKPAAKPTARRGVLAGSNAERPSDQSDREEMLRASMKLRPRTAG